MNKATLANPNHTLGVTTPALTGRCCGSPARGGLTVTKKRTEKRTPPAGNAPAGGKIYLPALSTPNSRLGQTEKSQNSSSENVAKTQIYQRFAGSR